MCQSFWSQDSSRVLSNRTRRKSTKSFQWEWSNTGTDCLERLWSLHPWRFWKGERTNPYTTTFTFEIYPAFTDPGLTSLELPLNWSYNSVLLRRVRESQVKIAKWWRLPLCIESNWTWREGSRRANSLEQTELTDMKQMRLPPAPQLRCWKD